MDKQYYLLEQKDFFKELKERESDGYYNNYGYREGDKTEKIRLKNAEKYLGCVEKEIKKLEQ